MTTTLQTMDGSPHTPTVTACDLPSDLPMVWITQGKTDHAAYILKIENDGRRLVKWAASELTQLVEADAVIKTELPKRRRRRPEATQNDYIFPSVAKQSLAKDSSGSATNDSPPSNTTKSKPNKKRPRKQQQQPKQQQQQAQVKVPPTTPSGKRKTEEVKVIRELKTVNSSATSSPEGSSIFENKKYPLGTKVYKEFPPFGWFSGRVVGHTQRYWYQVQYEDDDSEEMTEKELDKIVVIDSRTQAAGEATSPSEGPPSSSLRPKMTFLPRRGSALSATSPRLKSDSPTSREDSEEDETPIALMAAKKKRYQPAEEPTERKKARVECNGEDEKRRLDSSLTRLEALQEMKANTNMVIVEKNVPLAKQQSDESNDTTDASHHSQQKMEPPKSTNALLPETQANGTKTAMEIKSTSSNTLVDPSELSNNALSSGKLENQTTTETDASSAQADKQKEHDAKSTSVVPESLPAPQSRKDSTTKLAPTKDTSANFAAAPSKPCGDGTASKNDIETVSIRMLPTATPDAKKSNSIVKTETLKGDVENKPQTSDAPKAGGETHQDKMETGKIELEASLRGNFESARRVVETKKPIDEISDEVIQASESAGEQEKQEQEVPKLEMAIADKIEGRENAAKESTESQSTGSSSQVNFLVCKNVEDGRHTRHEGSQVEEQPIGMDEGVSPTPETTEGGAPDGAKAEPPQQERRVDPQQAMAEVSETKDGTQDAVQAEKNAESNGRAVAADIPGRGKENVPVETKIIQQDVKVVELASPRTIDEKKPVSQESNDPTSQQNEEAVEESTDAQKANAMDLEATYTEAKGSKNAVSAQPQAAAKPVLNVEPEKQLSKGADPVKGKLSDGVSSSVGQATEKEASQQQVVNSATASSDQKALAPKASKKRPLPPPPPARKSRRIAIKKDKKEQEAHDEEEEEKVKKKSKPSKPKPVKERKELERNQVESDPVERRASGGRMKVAVDEAFLAPNNVPLEYEEGRPFAENEEYVTTDEEASTAGSDRFESDRWHDAARTTTADYYPSEAHVKMGYSVETSPRDEDELDFAATLISMQSILDTNSGQAAPESGYGEADLAFANDVHSEETCCAVCGRHIASLEVSPVDWSRPLSYLADKSAVDAIIEHTAQYHSKAPIWNVLEAQHKLEFESVKSGTAEVPITPVAYVKLALRHAVCSSYSIDEDLLDMGKLRDMFIRRLGIARGFIRWSSDSFLEGRKFTNCGGQTVTNAELRQSALLLVAYLEEHVLEHAFEKNFKTTQKLSQSMPFIRWRNAVQCVFLDPNGVENAWFMADR